MLAPVGVSLMVYGFGAFFQLLPGTDASSIMLIYGFPMSLLGFALNYAQLKPVPLFSTAEALALRETQCTDIQKQLREDVTRYRYGDEQHLDEALNRIFRFNTVHRVCFSLSTHRTATQPKGIPRRLTPKLQAIREEARDGNYTLVLSFATSPDMTLEMWETRLDKIQSFFGPGITASLDKTERGVDVALTTDGSGAGRGGGQQQEVLPPLMPGLAPRVVNKQ